MSFPIPANEVERLRELSRFAALGEKPLPELQAICEVAAHVAGTPIALVTLVEATAQRFCANVGLPDLRGTSRDAAFCSHTILTPEPLVVPDAMRDPRFAGNVLVTDAPHIRAYAGVPLETALGCRVGALCVLDFRTRRFNKRQIAELTKLGLAASRLLTGHRFQAELLQSLAERAQKDELLRRAAEQDALTGLSNAAHFRERVETALAKTSQRSGAFVLIDLDHFKRVNDALGHAFGDRYLKAAARALQTVIRKGDSIGRLGGDEFAAFVTADGPEPRALAATLAERLHAKLRRAAIEAGRPELGRASIGVALAPDHATNYDDLYQRADVAMYEAKRAGRNCVRIYEPAMGRVVDLRARRTELLKALETGEMQPHYQPKIDLKSGALKGFEVLARWYRPDKTVQSPAAFDFAFTDMAVAPLLTRSVLTAAIREAAKWKAAGLFDGRISINVTTADLIDPEFPDDVAALLDAHAFEMERLTIEVTETVIMGEHDGQVRQSLKSLQAKGAQIAFDDFGTGYAGLQHLRNWPVDRLKIDKSFVASCVDNREDQLILQSMIDLAHKLGLVVVAEGVETEAQRAALLQLGADIGQGYLFSRPLSAADAEQWLARLAPARTGKVVPIGRRRR